MVHRLVLLCAVVLAAACASPGGPREPVRFESATRPAGSSSFPNWAEPPDVAMEKMTAGLTAEEIDAVWDRIEKLIQQVDAGDLPVF